MWKFLVILGFILLAGCKLTPDDPQITDYDLYVKIYYGSLVYNAAPKIEWVVDNVVVNTRFAPTSYYDTYYHAYFTIGITENEYPQIYSRVYFYNGFGTVVQYEEDQFFWLSGHYTNVVWPDI